MGVLSQSKYPQEARAFIEVLMSEKGQAVLDRYGFIPVAEK